jgi:TatD DNase family protein
MLAGNKGRQLAAAMPRDRILTETDGPFARKGSDPLMPWDVRDAECALANIWQLSYEDTHASLLRNFQKLVVDVESLSDV